jgi:hypothetical protein
VLVRENVVVVPEPVGVEGAVEVAPLVAVEAELVPPPLQPAKAAHTKMSPHMAEKMPPYRPLTICPAPRLISDLLIKISAFETRAGKLIANEWFQETCMSFQN